MEEEGVGMKGNIWKDVKGCKRLRWGGGWDRKDGKRRGG